MGIFELFISAIFVNNIVLSQNLGNCPYIGCSKEKGVALGMGGAVIFVIVLATIFTWLAQKYILVPLNIVYLQTLIFILIIASLVQFVEMFLKKAVPPLYSALGHGGDVGCAKGTIRLADRHIVFLCFRYRLSARSFAHGGNTGTP